MSTLIAYVMSLFGGIAAGCIAGYVYRYGLSLPFF
ncbi:NhaP-type Na+/H+ or K+/H+ antiporter [Rhodoligotrophos appendicifer]